MPYTKTEWINGSTPLNAENMNKIENGIESKQDKLIDSEEIVVDEGNHLHISQPIKNKIDRALLTPINTPSGYELVAVDSSKTQRMIEIGEGLQIDHGVLVNTAVNNKHLYKYWLQFKLVSPAPAYHECDFIIDCYSSRDIALNTTTWDFTQLSNFLYLVGGTTVSGSTISSQMVKTKLIDSTIEVADDARNSDITFMKYGDDLDEIFFVYYYWEISSQPIPPIVTIDRSWSFDNVYIQKTIIL